MPAISTNDPLQYVQESAHSEERRQLAYYAKLSTERRTRIEDLESSLSKAVEQIAVLSGQREIVVRERMTARVVEVTGHAVYLVVDDAEAVSRLHIARQRFAPGCEVQLGDTIFIDTVGSKQPCAKTETDVEEQAELRADLARVGAALRTRSLSGPVQL